ncbi:oxygen-independent coproporphyrinogen-3 oxidase [Agrobacterium vitis]|nr:oxygen-independent coproporphyrinogen-3 oxidase [Agrobacterium vitis]MBE1438429.1 oxygen-independent coproporphyrinogen-3 oxidase [Agrobacterium vitis]
MIAKDLLQKYSAAVPRYTSYPTAPHFHSGIDCGKYSQWLAGLARGQTVSLYIHIPYCDRLCWFCACHTRHTLKYAPIKTYLEALFIEIERIGALIDPEVQVVEVHLGGGSPTMLLPEDMIELMARLRAHFNFAQKVEISVEMDPNDLDDGRFDALAAIGLTRASLGVQDFDPQVQKAINRLQSFDQTKSVVEAVRARGATSVNCDILYGLPYQTVETLQSTVRDILSLAPDRVALFGYAHVPWMKKHQTMIAEDTLPDVGQRFEQMCFAAEMLCTAGYQPIGIDHFALPDDSMAIAAKNGCLRRNFQGYTTDAADALIGLGASSISQLPQGFVQNMAATGEYQRMVKAEGLAAVRGIALSSDDRARALVIEQIMCQFGFSFAQLRQTFPQDADLIIMEAKVFAGNDRDGLCTIKDDYFALTPVGRTFARSVAAVFDCYLSSGKARHSIAV